MAGLKSYGKACWYFGINGSLNARRGDIEIPGGAAFARATNAAS